MANFSINVDVNSKSVNQLEEDLQKLEAEFKTLKIGDPGFTELGNKIKGVRSQLKDVELQFEGLDKEQRATALVDTFNGLTGAVGAVSSAFIAFGASSQAIEDAEKKLLGVIGVVNGLRDVSNSFVAANKLLGNSFKSAFTTATGAINTTKVALAGLGIGAVIFAVTKLTEAFDLFGTKAAEDTKNAEKAIEQYSKKVQLLANINEQDYKDQVKAAQLAGKTDEEVAALRLQIRKKQFEEIQAQGAKLKLGQTKEREELIKIEKGYVAEIDALEVAAFQRKQQRSEKVAADAKAKSKAQADNEVKAVKDKNEAIRALDEAQATEGLDAITTKYANELARIKEAQAEELKQDNLTAQAKQDIKDKFAIQAQTNEINRQKEVEAFTKDQNQKAIDDAKAYNEELAAAKEKEFQDTLKSVTDFYAQQELIQKQNLANGVITQQQFDQQLLQINADKNNALLTATKDYGQSTVEVETTIADAQIASNAKVKASEQAKQAAQLEFLSATQGAVSALGGLFEEGSNAAKAAALTDIAIGTGVGFIRALAIAQESSEATGPAAAFAFPIFYASQIAAVLSAASRAKAILNSGKGGGTSAPSKTTVPSVGGYSGPSQGFLGGLPQIPSQTTGGGTTGGYGGSQTGGPRGGVFKTYVLAGDVTSAQAAEAKINQRRQF